MHGNRHRSEEKELAVAYSTYKNIVFSFFYVVKVKCFSIYSSFILLIFVSHVIAIAIVIVILIPLTHDSSFIWHTLVFVCAVWLPDDTVFIWTIRSSIALCCGKWLIYWSRLGVRARLCTSLGVCESVCAQYTNWVYRNRFSHSFVAFLYSKIEKLAAHSKKWLLRIQSKIVEHGQCDHFCTTVIENWATPIILCSFFGGGIERFWLNCEQSLFLVCAEQKTKTWNQNHFRWIHKNRHGASKRAPCAHTVHHPHRTRLTGWMRAPAPNTDVKFIVHIIMFYWLICTTGAFWNKQS